MCRFLSFVQDADGNIYHLHPDIVVDVENLPVQVFGKTSTGNERTRNDTTKNRTALR